MSTRASLDPESIRNKFRPKNIVLLMVGESPPPHVGFFYDVDAREGALSRTTRQAMEQACDRKLERMEFLEIFKKKCYLIDLFQDRGKTVDIATGAEKETAVLNLAAFLRRENPVRLVSVLRRIDSLVVSAVVRSHMNVRYRNLPYPMRKGIGVYRRGLKTIFQDADVCGPSDLEHAQTCYRSSSSRVD